MYILSKLTQDFKEGIFCEAKNDTISLIGARNHLTVLLKLKRRDDSILGDTTSLNWNYSYVFKSEEVRRNINWFHTKANARMQLRLALEPTKSEIKIHHDRVEGAKLSSFLKNPPVPVIRAMEDGKWRRIEKPEAMVKAVESIRERIIELRFFDSRLELSGKEEKTPSYPVEISKPKAKKEEYSTLCYREMLKISCQLVYDTAFPKGKKRGTTSTIYLKSFAGGATQLYATTGEFNPKVSLLCQLTSAD